MWLFSLALFTSCANDDTTANNSTNDNINEVIRCLNESYFAKNYKKKNLIFHNAYIGIDVLYNPIFGFFCSMIATTRYFCIIGI